MLGLSNNGTFPSQAISDEYKNSLEYGLRVATAVENEWFRQDSGNSRYYSNRDNFHRLRLYARGEQPIQKYKDELSINGDLSYLNLDWKNVPIIPKFVDIVVNGMDGREHEIKAFAQDPASIQKKTEYVENVISDMQNTPLLDTAENALGINMYKTDKSKLPNTEDEFLIHMQLEFKDSIEIAQETVLNSIFDINKYNLLRTRNTYDLVTTGIAANRVRFNKSDGIVLEYCDPVNLIYSHTEDPYFEDIYYIGEVKKVNVLDLKKEFPELTDDDIKQLEGYNNSTMRYEKTYSKGESNDKNYVYVTYFEYKTYNHSVHKIKKTSTGGDKALEKNDKFNPPTDDRSRFSKESSTNEVIYEGVKIVGLNKVLKWELAKNMMRPKSSFNKVKFSYNVVAPRMYKGKINSLVSRMITFADMIQLTHLKLQQVMSRIVPDGVYLDADGLAEIDLGNGTNYSPQEALNMFLQTGSVIGRSMTQDGDFNNGKVPIQEIQTSNGQAKITSLINSYNFNLQMIRDVTGLNEARDGSMPDSRALVGIQKLAAANSNTATRHILDGSLYLTLLTAECVSIRVSDVIEFSPMKDSFIRLLGNFNFNTLKEVKNLHLHDFGIFLELSPDEEEKQLVENNIQVALSKEQIYLEDAIDIRNVKNLKLANELLKVRRKNKLKLDRQMQMENIQAQANSNAQAAQAAAQTEVQKEQALASNKIDISEAQSKFDIALLEKEAAIKKELMQFEFDLNMQLREKDKEGIDQKEKYKEDRKDSRTKIQASQQSELIDQRKNNKPPKNFESAGMDVLNGGFSLGSFDPK